MNPLDRDPFEIWRLILSTSCTIYAIVITIRSLMFLAGMIDTGDKHAKLVRNYVVVHLLRLRGGRFKRELSGIGLYSLLLIVLLILH